MLKRKHLCIYIVIGENGYYEEAGIFEAENTDDLCQQMLAKTLRKPRLSCAEIFND